MPGFTSVKVSFSFILQRIISADTDNRACARAHTHSQILRYFCFDKRKKGELGSLASILIRNRKEWERVLFTVNSNTFLLGVKSFFLEYKLIKNILQCLLHYKKSTNPQNSSWYEVNYCSSPVKTQGYRDSGKNIYCFLFICLLFVSYINYLFVSAEGPSPFPSTHLATQIC